METLSDSTWDVIISGTDLKNSLLALALSRSHKKILHIDENRYYGGTTAALSLDEADEWASKHMCSRNVLFHNVSLWRTDIPDDLAKLSPSRSYNLSLSPFIIYSNSKLLEKLVSSAIHRQIEFLAVGNWWIFEDDSQTLKKIPNGREDIFLDVSIDNKSKRSLMKFLRFVVDFENNAGAWSELSEASLEHFLASQFQLGVDLRKTISAISLTLHPPDKTTVAWALPRISRHLNSYGVLGTGFNAVYPKWGCGSEISQAACRACAVGGATYILGTTIERTYTTTSESEELTGVRLSNGIDVETRYLTPTSENDQPDKNEPVSRIVAVTTTQLSSLFQCSIEGAPTPAVCVVNFPSGTLKIQDSTSFGNPIYLSIHSSETGECPEGQYIINATTIASNISRIALELSISTFLSIVGKNEGKLLYKLYFEFSPGGKDRGFSDHLHEQPNVLTFDDRILDEVETQWQTITVNEKDPGDFMRFQDRENETLYDSD
ncbi:Rab proteins geranylgeranyltransferase component A [Golovinomyces cichoracearum]|uniref:Rab proteins geranylgeranyltransferase n=1 Tax=Golovinomyces cichoracearum TaxID=62708 RepID=A0A420HUL6_9PEZI|nr:Rab proteins geranylgeranyltransferase component A [Golovinomyces cichoracearum]